MLTISELADLASVESPQDETREGLRIFLDARKTLRSLLTISGPRVGDHMYVGSPRHSRIALTHAI